MKQGVIETVDRALQILELFESEPSLGLIEISQKLELSKSTVHRLLKTLEERGYIFQEPTTRKYRLGVKLIHLGLNLLNQMDIRKIAQPVMKNLVSLVSETTTLVILNNCDGICIEKIDSPHRIRIFTEVGRIIPLYAGALGKAILAYLPEERIRRILKIKRNEISPKVLEDGPDNILKDLEKIREMGYAVSFGELTPGAAGLAAPIKNHFGEVIASLGFAGPANRFSSRDLVELTTVLIESADKISTMLGYINKDEVIFFNNLPERSSES